MNNQKEYERLAKESKYFNAKVDYSEFYINSEIKNDVPSDYKLKFSLTTDIININNIFQAYNFSNIIENYAIK